jgi:hypothetical protein
MNLSEIFNNTGAGGGGLGAFDSTPPAPEMEPLPPNVYDAVVVHGELVQTRSGNDGYRIRFRIAEGPHAGRLVFRTWSFSERALPYARRDLGQFGLTTSAQLLAPFPEPGREYRVKLWVAVQWRRWPHLQRRQESPVNNRRPDDRRPASTADRRADDRRATAGTGQVRLAKGRGVLMTADCDVGVLVAGPVSAPRCLVEHRATLAAFAQDETQYYGEAYLSHYIFGEELEQHYAANRNSVAGFAGPCRADWLLWDIDEHDPVAALTSARRLVGFIPNATAPTRRFGSAARRAITSRCGWPTTPRPARRSRPWPDHSPKRLADAAGVRVDSAVVRPQPHCATAQHRHAKTGLFKVPNCWPTNWVLRPKHCDSIARIRAGCRCRSGDGDTDRLAADWAAVEARVGRAAQARAERRAEFTPDTRAPRYFLEFVRFGAARASGQRCCSSVRLG